MAVLLILSAMPKDISFFQSIVQKDDYETPIPLLQNAMKDFIIYPELDVSASSNNAKFERYYTEQENALIQDWSVDFFMNCPYSQIGTWLQKAYLEHVKHNVNGLILMYAKTDTRYWHKYIEEKAEVHFIQGRIKFLLDNIPTKNNSPFPSCWVIYRKKFFQNDYSIDYEPIDYR